MFIDMLTSISVSDTVKFSYRMHLFKVVEGISVSARWHNSQES